jgi:ribosomal protein L15
MVKRNKRNKRTRLRGSRSAGMGFRKKKKGHGNKGGHGWSGTGKRGSQKQQKALMYAQSLGYEKYFGKRGLTSAPSAKKRTEQINLDDVKANYFQKEGQKIELKLHKILGEGEGFKAEIHAKGATQTAIDKMAKAGGKIVLAEKKVFVKTEKAPKTEKKTDAPKAEVKKTAEKKVVAKKK